MDTGKYHCARSKLSKTTHFAYLLVDQYKNQDTAARPQTPFTPAVPVVFRTPPRNSPTCGCGSSRMWTFAAVLVFCGYVHSVSVVNSRC
nr:hypothetical protein BgiMline_001026 [Biomphalaria glabrata]